MDRTASRHEAQTSITVLLPALIAFPRTAERCKRANHNGTQSLHLIRSTFGQPLPPFLHPHHRAPSARLLPLRLTPHASHETTGARGRRRVTRKSIAGKTLAPSRALTTSLRALVGCFLRRRLISPITSHTRRSVRKLGQYAQKHVRGTQPSLRSLRRAATVPGLDATARR